MKISSLFGQAGADTLPWAVSRPKLLDSMNNEEIGPWVGLFIHGFRLRFISLDQVMGSGLLFVVSFGICLKYVREINFISISISIFEMFLN